MKVSVIIPIYNSEKFLEKCLDSVYAQTLKDYEVILVNDGSTDTSGEIIERYKAGFPEKTVLLTVENGGQGRAKNLGLDLARGEYVLNIDSDDYVAPDMLEKMVLAGDENNADVVICDFYRIVEGRQYYENARLTPNPLSAVGQCWNKLFRRTLIGEVRYPCGRWYEDTEFSAKLLLRSEKTVFVKEALYYYNIGHPSTMRNSNAAKNLDIIPVLEQIRQYAEDNGLPLDLDYFVLTHVVLEAIKRVSSAEGGDGKERRETVRKLRTYAREKLPHILSSPAFREETGNRRLIMWLNYQGMDGLSNLLLKIKNRA